MATVLIVDNDPVSRTILKSILQNLSYTTFEADDGRTGTNIYREHRPDVVILEMLMPEKDGFETLFDLRKISHEAKIIMMTGGGRITIDLYQKLAHSLRIPELLIKPFSAEVVAKAVANMLNLSEPNTKELLEEGV